MRNSFSHRIMITRNACLSRFGLLTMNNIHYDKDAIVIATSAGAILVLFGMIAGVF
jgi:hypothetical protein